MKSDNPAAPTPFPELNDVLRLMAASMQEILGENFTGVYLQGSFAVGDFDVHSDVDWIVVLEEALSASETAALQAMHGRIFGLDSPWAQHLEGSYFPKDVLRHADRRGTDLWYLDHGASSLIESNHCNTVLVRWVVREYGVTLAGPPPKTLVDPIAVETLRAEIREGIAYWGRDVLDHPEHYNNRFYQAYIVLNWCRMLHDLHRGYPGSKRAGAEWAKANLDPSWADLIDRAWDGRPDPAYSVRQPADAADFARSLEFVAYVMAESARFVPEDAVWGGRDGETASG